MSSENVRVMQRDTGQVVVMLGPFHPEAANNIADWIAKALAEKRAINLICGPGRGLSEEGEPKNPVDGGSRHGLDDKLLPEPLDDE